MALHVADSLHSRRGVDLHDITARYLEWWRDGAFDTGPTVARVLGLVDRGATFDQAAARADDDTGGMTGGCNPAHRCAPLAMCAAIEDAVLPAAACAEAQLTHRHPLAGDAAAAVACLCRALIRGAAWLDALGRAGAGRRRETRDALEVTQAVRLSRSGFAPEALKAAVYFVATSASFPEALTRSLEFAGPANYCPVLVGSIGGARWGSASIDDALLGHHGDLAARLRAAAEALAGEW